MRELKELNINLIRTHALKELGERYAIRVYTIHWSNGTGVADRVA